MLMCQLLSHVQHFWDSLWTVAHQVPLSMDFPGSNPAVGFHFLLRGIFLTQGSNPGLLHCRRILYQLSHQGSLVSSCNSAKARHGCLKMPSFREGETTAFNYLEIEAASLTSARWRLAVSSQWTLTISLVGESRQQTTLRWLRMCQAVSEIEAVFLFPAVWFQDALANLPNVSRDHF